MFKSRNIKLLTKFAAKYKLLYKSFKYIKDIAASCGIKIESIRDLEGNLGLIKITKDMEAYSRPLTITFTPLAPALIAGGEGAYKSESTTLLIQAIREENYPAVHALLNLGAKVNDLDDYAIYEAVIHKDITIVKLLLQYGAKVVNRKRDKVMSSILQNLCTSHKLSNDTKKNRENPCVQKLPTPAECELIKIIFQHLKDVEFIGDIEGMKRYVRQPLSEDKEFLRAIHTWKHRATNGHQFWMQYGDQESEARKFNLCGGELLDNYVDIYRELIKLDDSPHSECIFPSFEADGLRGKRCLHLKMQKPEKIEPYMTFRRIRPLRHFARIGNVKMVRMLIEEDALDYDIRNPVSPGEETTLLTAWINEIELGSIVDGSLEDYKQANAEIREMIIEYLEENKSKYGDKLGQYVNTAGPPVLEEEIGLPGYSVYELVCYSISNMSSKLAMTFHENNNREELEKSRERLLTLGCRPTPRSMVVDLMSEEKVDENAVMNWVQLLMKEHETRLLNLYLRGVQIKPERGIDLKEKMNRTMLFEYYQLLQTQSERGIDLKDKTYYRDWIYPIIMYLCRDNRMGMNKNRALYLANRIISRYQEENGLGISLLDEIQNLPTFIFEYIWGKYIENAAISAGLHETIYGDIEWIGADGRLCDQGKEREVKDRTESSWTELSLAKDDQEDEDSVGLASLSVEELEEKVSSNKTAFCQSIRRGSVEIEKINKAKRDAFLSFMQECDLAEKSYQKEQEGKEADGSRRDRQTDVGLNDKVEKQKYKKDRLAGKSLGKGPRIDDKIEGHKKGVNASLGESVTHEKEEYGLKKEQVIEKIKQKEILQKELVGQVKSTLKMQREEGLIEGGELGILDFILGSSLLSENDVDVKMVEIVTQGCLEIHAKPNKLLELSRTHREKSLLKIFLDCGLESYIERSQGISLLSAIINTKDTGLCIDYCDWIQSRKIEGDEHEKHNQIIEREIIDLLSLSQSELIEKFGEKYLDEDYEAILRRLLENAQCEAIFSDNAVQYEEYVTGLFAQAKVDKKKKCDLRALVITGSIDCTGVLNSGISIFEIASGHCDSETLFLVMGIAKAQCWQAAKNEYFKGEQDKKIKKKPIKISWQSGRVIEESSRIKYETIPDTDQIQDVAEARKKGTLMEVFPDVIFELEKTKILACAFRNPLIEQIPQRMEDAIENSQVVDNIRKMSDESYSRLLTQSVLARACTNGDENCIYLIAYAFMSSKIIIDEKYFLNEIEKYDLSPDMRLKNYLLIHDVADGLNALSTTKGLTIRAKMIDIARQGIKKKSNRELMTLLISILTTHHKDDWIIISRVCIEIALFLILDIKRDFSKASDFIVEVDKVLYDTMEKFCIEGKDGRKKKKLSQLELKEKWKEFSLLHRQSGKIFLGNWLDECKQYPKVPEHIGCQVSITNADFEKCVGGCDFDQVDEEALRAKKAIEEYFTNIKNQELFEKELMAKGAMVEVCDGEKIDFLKKWFSNPRMLVEKRETDEVSFSNDVLQTSQGYTFSPYASIEGETWKLIGEYAEDKKKVELLMEHHAKQIVDGHDRDILCMRYLARKVLKEERVKTLAAKWRGETDKAIQWVESIHTTDTNQKREAVSGNNRLCIGNEFYAGEMDRNQAWIWIRHACRKAQVRGIVKEFLRDNISERECRETILKRPEVMAVFYETMSTENQGCENWFTFMVDWFEKMKCFFGTLGKIEVAENEDKESPQMAELIALEEDCEQLKVFEKEMASAIVMGDSEKKYSGVREALYLAVTTTNREELVKRKVDSCCRIVKNTRKRLANEIRKWTESLVKDMIRCLLCCCNGTEIEMGQLMLREALASSTENLTAEEIQRGVKIVSKKINPKTAKKDSTELAEGDQLLERVVAKSKEVLCIEVKGDQAIVIDLTKKLKDMAVELMEREGRADAVKDANELIKKYVQMALEMSETYKNEGLGKKTDDVQAQIKSLEYLERGKKITHSTMLFCESGGLLRQISKLYDFMMKRDGCSIEASSLQSAWYASGLGELEDVGGKKKRLSEEIDDFLRGVKDTESLKIPTRWINKIFQVGVTGKASEHPMGERSDEKVSQEVERADLSGVSTDHEKGSSEQEKYRSEKNKGERAGMGEYACDKDEIKKIERCENNRHLEDDVENDRHNLKQEDGIEIARGNLKQEDGIKRVADELDNMKMNCLREKEALREEVTYYGDQETKRLIEKIIHCLELMKDLIVKIYGNGEISKEEFGLVQNEITSVSGEYKQHQKIIEKGERGRESINIGFFSCIEEKIERLIQIADKRKVEDSRIRREASVKKAASKEKDKSTEERRKGKQVVVKLSPEEVAIESGFKGVFKTVSQLGKSDDADKDKKIDLEWARYMASLYRSGLEDRVVLQNRDLVNVIFHKLTIANMMRCRPRDFMGMIRDMRVSGYNERACTTEDRLNSVVVMGRWIEILIGDGQNMQDLESAVLIGFLILNHIGDIRKRDKDLEKKYKRFLKPESHKSIADKIWRIRTSAAHAYSASNKNGLFSDHGALRLGSVIFGEKDLVRNLRGLRKISDFCQRVLEGYKQASQGQDRKSDGVNSTGGFESRKVCTASRSIGLGQDQSSPAGQGSVAKAEKTMVEQGKRSEGETVSLEGLFARCGVLGKKVYEIEQEIKKPGEKGKNKLRDDKIQAAASLQRAIEGIKSVINNQGRKSGSRDECRFYYFGQDSAIESQDKVQGKAISEDSALLFGKGEKLMVVVDHKHPGQYRIWPKRPGEEVFEDQKLKEMIRCIDRDQVVDYCLEQKNPHKDQKQVPEKGESDSRWHHPWH